MGTNTLTDVVSGTVQPSHVNNIHTALEGDVVPRNNSGVPTDSAGSLGTPSLQWDEVRAKRLFQDGDELGTTTTGSTRNQVISGKTRSGSEQPVILTPAGLAGGTNATIAATTTNLVFDVNGTQVTVTADIALSSLTAAPSTNNTALVNDTDLADQAASRTYGEYLAEKEYIDIDTVGTEISSRVGEVHAFKHGSEYFLALIESTTRLSNILRGFFFDSSDAPIKRDLLTNNDTITFMSTGWVFIQNDGATTDVTYNPPIWSATEPSAPASGDYWYDLADEEWKRYNGAAYVSINRTLLGILVLDSTDCIAARSVDFPYNPQRENTVELVQDSNSQVSFSRYRTKINVAGKIIDFAMSKPQFDMASHLAGSADLYDATEQANRRYFHYITRTGELKISDIEPYWRDDWYGFYHPYNPWRAVGYSKNNGTSNFDYTSDLPGNLDDQETDFISYVQGSSQSFTGQTWVTFTLGTEAKSNGSAIIISTNDITFTKRGYYRIYLYFAGQTATAEDDFDTRLYDSTRSNAIYNNPTVILNDADSGENENHTLVMEFPITYLGSTYNIQGLEASTKNVTLVRKHVLIERVKGLYIGAE